MMENQENENAESKMVTTNGSVQLLTSDHPSAETSPQEVLSEDEWEDYIPEPPDGGWGWVIMIASFFNNFIVDGIAYCFGVFLAEYTKYFQISVANASFANALLFGIYLLMGPVVGALVNKFGCRPVGVAGSIVAAFAFVISTFSPSMLFFHFSYGIIGGCGFGMMYLPAVVGVGFYFEKKRALATGFAVCGTGIGTFALAPFAKLLLNHVDWKYAHFTFAGFILQGCIFSSLMRPVTIRRRRKVSKILTNFGDDGKRLLPSASDDAALTLPITNSKEIVHVKTSNHPQRLYASAYLTPQHTNQPQKLHASAYISSPTRTTAEKIRDLQRPMYIKSIFYSGSVCNIHKSQQEVGPEHAESAQSIPSSEDHNHRLSCLRKLPKPMADILAEMLDLHVLRSKGMAMLLLANFFGMLGFYAPIIFSVDRAVQYGVKPENAALLVSILGISNTVGRVLTGIIAFLPRVSPLLLNNICIALSGVTVLLTPFCTTFHTMALAVGSYGLFAATVNSLISVIICELVGLEKLTNGFGLICMVKGITSIVGPPLLGLLYDATGNYDATFYVGGVCIVASAGLQFLLHLQYFRAPIKKADKAKPAATGPRKS